LKDLKFILDGFEWSFSRINAYCTCPRMFYMSYIQCLDKTGNAFAEWGSFGHYILEKYFRKELEFFELSNIYSSEYEGNVKASFPPNPYVNLNHRYYDVGKEYFDTFEGLFEKAEILGVEEEIHINIDKYKFVGYIDLILRDDKGIIIVDHKSKSKFKSKKEKDEYLRQLYLYSIHIYEKYGEYPYMLVFNMFRANEIIEEKFDITAYELAKEWAVDTIEKIYKDMDFKSSQDDFFCNWLCSCNAHCACSDKYMG